MPSFIDELAIRGDSVDDSRGRHMNFFNETEKGRGPPVSRELIRAAEQKLGLRLPAAYLALLSERNGGTPRRRCFKTSRPTSWARDHIAVQTLLGVGYDDGLDGQFGSEYMVREWGYPPIGVVVFDTPSGGADTVMLDYSRRGPLHEPRVVYVDEDRSVLVLADDFAQFTEKLTDCAA